MLDHPAMPISLISSFFRHPAIASSINSSCSTPHLSLCVRVYVSRKSTRIKAMIFSQSQSLQYFWYLFYRIYLPGFANCLPCKNFKIKKIKIFQSHKKETHERTIALRNSIFLQVLLPFFYGESLRLQLLYMKLHPLWLTCYNTFSLHFSSMELDWSWTKVLLHLWHHMECQDLGNVRKKKLVKKSTNHYICC